MKHSISKRKEMRRGFVWEFDFQISTES